MRRRTVLLATALLTLTACGGGDDPSSADITADDDTAAADTAADDTAADDTTTSAVTTTVPLVAPITAAATPTPADPGTTEPPAMPSTGNCLVGSWIVTEAEMNAFYDAVETAIDQPIDFTVSGHTGLTFTDATYAWTPEFTLDLQLAGITGAGEAGGSITGTYTTADGILTTEVTESAMTLTVQVAGQTIDGSDLGNGFITNVPFANAPFSCDGPTPVIEFETIDGRHAVTLVPAS